MLAGENLECVRGGRDSFSNLSFSVPSGTLLRVSDANGAGKTSLLRILCGMLLPSSGEVIWRSSPVRKQRESYWRELRYIGDLAGIKIVIDTLVP